MTSLCLNSHVEQRLCSRTNPPATQLLLESPQLILQFQHLLVGRRSRCLSVSLIVKSQTDTAMMQLDGFQTVEMCLSALYTPNPQQALS
jgi:hypothetical protein